MKEIITIINQKGGVGKTSTASALAAAFTERGERVLAVDLDPQGNLGLGYGICGDFETRGVSNVFKGQAIGENVIRTSKGFDLLAGSNELNNVDTFVSPVKRVSALKLALTEVVDDYDYVVIDTPPTISTLALNAIVAANSVVIPMQPSKFALAGLDKLVDQIGEISGYLSDVAIKGILLTMYNERLVVTREMMTRIHDKAETLGITVFDSKIRVSTSIAEAQLAEETIYDYEGTGRQRAAEDYKAFFAEVWGEQHE